MEKTIDRALGSHRWGKGVAIVGGEDHQNEAGCFSGADMARCGLRNKKGTWFGWLRGDMGDPKC